MEEITKVIEINKETEIKKCKEERVFVKSNKGKKIELKNLDTIKLLEESGEIEPWTYNELSKIKNSTFKNNIFDVENKLIVSSIRLKKISKLGRNLTPMIWEYYKNRGNMDVNFIIKQYGRNNLIINYSLHPQQKKTNIIIESNDDIYDNDGVVDIDKKSIVTK
jgi:hypothetical protein